MQRNGLFKRTVKKFTETKINPADLDHANDIESQFGQALPTSEEMQNLINRINASISNKHYLPVMVIIGALLAELILLTYLIRRVLKSPTPSSYLNRFNKSIFEASNQSCTEVSRNFKISHVCDPFIPNDSEFFDFCFKIAATLCSELLVEELAIRGLMFLSGLIAIFAAAYSLYLKEVNKGLGNLEPAVRQELLKIGKQTDLVKKGQSLGDLFESLEAHMISLKDTKEKSTSMFIEPKGLK